MTSLEPRRETIEPMLEKEADDDQDRLAQLFAYKLPRPPTPPPTPKPRIQLSHSERKAKLEEKRARADLIRQASGRHTRARAGDGQLSEVQDVSILPRDLRPPPERPVKPREPKNVSRSRQKARQGSNGSEQAAEGVTRLERKERGVLGKITIDYLTDRERRQREKQLGLVVDQVDAKANFERFNVGWVLPEGTRRGGRPMVAPVTPSVRPKGRTREQSPSKRVESTVRDIVSDESSDLSDAPSDDHFPDAPNEPASTTSRRIPRAPATRSSSRIIPPPAPSSPLSAAESSADLSSEPALYQDHQNLVDTPLMTRTLRARAATAFDTIDAQSATPRTPPTTRKRKVNETVEEQSRLRKRVRLSLSLIHI